MISKHDALSRKLPPSFDKVTRLTARAIGTTPDILLSSLRPAVHADLSSILGLRLASFGSELSWDDEGYLRWRYGLAERQNGFGEMYVLRIGERLLGIIGTESIRIISGNEVIRGLTLMDLLIDPSVEGAGLGVWLNMAMFERSSLTLSIGANINSIGIVERLYYRLPNRVCYAYPLQMLGYLQRRLPSAWLAAVVAAPGNAALRLARWGVFPRPPPNIEFKKIYHFDTSADALFNERDSWNDITVERSAHWLNWRLFGNPRVEYEVVGAYEAGRLLGYIATHRRAPMHDSVAVEVVDWLVTKRDGSSIFHHLMADVVRRSVDAGAEVVRVTALCERVGRSLRSLGFITQKNNYFTVGIHVADQQYEAALSDSSRWILTDANTDTDGR